MQYCDYLVQRGMEEQEERRRRQRDGTVPEFIRLFCNIIITHFQLGIIISISLLAGGPYLITIEEVELVGDKTIECEFKSLLLLVSNGALIEPQFVVVVVL